MQPLLLMCIWQRWVQSVFFERLAYLGVKKGWGREFDTQCGLGSVI